MTSQHTEPLTSLNYLNKKKLVLYLAVISILSISSVLSYFKLREIYWAAELSPYLFTGISSIFLLITLLKSRSPISVTWIDLSVISCLLYTVSATYYVSYPFTPSDKLYDIFGILTFYLWLRIEINSTYDRTKLLKCIFLIIAMQGLLGILQKTTVLPSPNIYSGVEGTFINPGLYGCFMSIGSIIGMYLILICKGTKPRLTIFSILSLITLTALILSASRTANITTLIALSLMLYAFYHKSISLSRYFNIIVLLVVLTFTAFGIYFLWKLNMESVSGRLLIWKVSISMWRDHVLLGIGYGNFFSQYANYQSDYFLSGRGTQAEINIAGMNYYPFNEFLKIGIESGITGLILFLIMLLCSLKAGWLLLKSNVKQLLPYLLIVFSVAIFGLFSYPLQSSAISCVLYCSLAVIASSAKIVKVFHLKSLYKSAFIIPVIMLIFLSAEKINALNCWRNAKESIRFAEGDAVRNYKKIYPTLSANGAFLYNYGAELAELGLYEQSLPILKRAERYGNSVNHQQKLARISHLLHEDYLAEKYYLTAAYIDPKLFTPLYDLLIFYQQTQQIGKAVEIGNKIMTKPIKIPSNKIEQIKVATAQFLKFYYEANENNLILNHKKQ